jgi:hypothetical protein
MNGGSKTGSGVGSSTPWDSTNGVSKTGPASGRSKKDERKSQDFRAEAKIEGNTRAECWVMRHVKYCKRPS